MKLTQIEKKFYYGTTTDLKSAIYLFYNEELNVTIEMYIKLDVLKSTVENLVNEFVSYFSEIELPKNTLINVSLVRYLNDIRIKIDSNNEKLNFVTETSLVTSKVVLHYLKYWINSLKDSKLNISEPITVDIKNLTDEEICQGVISYPSTRKS